MPLSQWSERLDYDVRREAIIRLHNGSLQLLDGSSDDDGIVDFIRNPQPEMRFRLTYDGSLKASSNGKTRSKEKWDIRRHLQPQLAELWEVHPALLGFAMAYAREGLIGTTPAVKNSEWNRQQLRKPTTIGGHDFLPLVRSSLSLSCSLDILFLRKDSPGSVVSHGGDLDNRLKTLFDGLKMPKEKTEIEAGDLSDSDPSPFHCLLEDDKLVSALTVRTDRLLSRPGAPRDEVRLIMDVIITPTRIEITRNSGFVAD